MFIVEKGNTPDGMRIQIENWSDLYPETYNKNDTIGFYPMAVNDIYTEGRPDFPPYPKRGQTFRSSLRFDNEDETKKAFDLLQSGEKTYMDYLDKYSNHVIRKEDFIKAVSN